MKDGLYTGEKGQRSVLETLIALSVGIPGCNGKFQVEADVWNVRLTVEKPIVSLTVKPATPCVHPVFEFRNAPRTLSRVELDARMLSANDYAWDGRTLWLNHTLRHEAALRLTFSE
jgi:hypothetical protein